MEVEASGDAGRRRELCEFLKDARARISPSEVGLVATGRRRVPGLRRDEVAALCGVSVAWYTWFETGRKNVRASPRFIAAVARSLRLGTRETTYLFSLAIAEMPKLAPPVPMRSEALPRELLATLPHHGDAGAAALAACEFFAIGIYCTAPDGTIFYANRALVQLMGYANKAAYMDLNVSRDLYEDARERHVWQSVIERAGSLDNVVIKARRADGTRVYVRDTAVAVRANHGSVLCYLGTWQQVH